MPLNVTVASLVAFTVLRAQPAAAIPKFEVASIKPGPNCMVPLAAPLLPGSLPRTAPPPPPPPPRPGGPDTAGRFNECRPLADFIRMAYVVYADGHFHGALFGSPFAAGPPIEGAPGWVASDPYQILAKAEGTPSRETISGPMLQALLEERFHLKLHKATREMSIYALTVAKGGAKLQASKVDCVRAQPEGPPQMLAPGQTRCVDMIGGKKGPNTGVQMQGDNLDTFCEMLSRLLDGPVVNKTGITGKFDIQLEFAIDESTPALVPGASDEPAAPSVFTAIQKQLGLKLEPGMGPRDSIVIDHVERPSAN